MKRIYFLLPLFFVCFFTQGQGFIHFPDSTYWHLKRDNAVGGPCTNNSVAYVLEYFDGDTLINSLTYRVIREKYLGCYSGSCGYCEVYHTSYIREDTVENKVFLYVNGIDTLLYDYNLQVGDTIKEWHADPFGWIIDTVTQVDTIFLRNKNRRVWRVTNFFSIVEGFGTTRSGVKAPVYGFPYEGVLLTCIHDTLGPVLYPNLYAGTPCFPYSVNEKDNITQQIAVYPNPTDEGFTLHIKEPVFSDISITVRNTLGTVCYQQTITGKEHYVSTETWAKGVYLVEAFSENILLGRQKLIKH